MTALDKVSNLLQSTTERVIFYSCLSQPMTIPEIAKSWGYRSAAYFYHSNSRELLKRLIKSRLIFTKRIGKGREQLLANYDILFEESDIASFFERVNTDIETELIQEEYPEISEGQLSDSFFREYCLDKKPELTLRAQKISFGQQTISHLIPLWQDNLFKRVFLGVKSLTEAFHRSDLPGNPRKLLFGITSALTAELFELEKGRAFLEPPFTYLFVDFDVSDTLPAILEQLDLAANPKDKAARIEFESFVSKFQNVYDALKEKILAYAEVEEVGSYHIRRFASLMKLDAVLKTGREQERGTKL